MPRGPKPEITSIAEAGAWKPPPPVHLAETMKELWTSIVSTIPVSLSHADIPALFVFVTSVDMYYRAQAFLDAEGIIVANSNDQPTTHPAATAQRYAWDRIRSLMASFGMTPADRERLGLRDPNSSTAADEFA